MHQLSAGAVARLIHLAETEGCCPLVDGEVRMVLDDLPGRAVVGVARQGDRLWIILDLDKPDPYQHLVKLVNAWPLDDSERSRSVTSGQTIDDVTALLAPFTSRTSADAPEVIRWGSRCDEQLG